MPNLIWPFQNNPEPPDDGEHYEECGIANDAYEVTGCICHEIAEERKQDAAERKYDYMKEN